MDMQEEISALAILIQDLRKHKKYTLKDLADKIGRSVGFLSQVERGLSRPTVADLTAISETLGVPTTYFYSLPKPMALPWVTRPDERRTLYYADGITDILVSPKMRASFSMLESQLEPGASSGDRHMKDSSEQGGYVLEGELTLWLDDRRTGDPARRRQLSTGQSCPLPLRQPLGPTDPRALGLHLIKTTRNKTMDAVCSDLLAEVRDVSPALPRGALRRPDFPGHSRAFLRQALPDRDARKSRRRQRRSSCRRTACCSAPRAGCSRSATTASTTAIRMRNRRLVPGTLKLVSWEKQPLGADADHLRRHGKTDRVRTP